MTEHPPVEVDPNGDEADGKGRSFAATLADRRMPYNQATCETFGRIWGALCSNRGMETFTLNLSDVHISEVKFVGVYGDDEGTVVYMTTHTPQTVQRVRVILAKLFETFDQQVKSRIVLKGNVRRFTAVDQARLESMCRTNPTPIPPKVGTAPSRLVPKTKEGLKNYVDEYSDDYDDEDAPVKGAPPPANSLTTCLTILGLADAPASSWETPRLTKGPCGTLALADAAAPSTTDAEESLADAEDQVAAAARRLEELDLRTAQTETEQTETSSERAKTQLELSTLTLVRDQLVDEVQEVTAYVATLTMEHQEALERRRFYHGAPAVVYLVMPPGGHVPLYKSLEVHCAAQRCALLLKRAQTQLGCLGLPLHDLLPHVAKIAFGLATRGIFPMPLDNNKMNRLVDDVLNVSLRLEKECKSAAENEVKHTCKTGGAACAACDVLVHVRTQVRERGKDCAACQEADFVLGGLCDGHMQEQRRTEVEALLKAPEVEALARRSAGDGNLTPKAPAAGAPPCKRSKKDTSKQKKVIRDTLQKEVAVIQSVTEAMSDKCCQCAKACNATMFLHHPTQNWWPCNDSQANQARDAHPAPVLYDKEQLDKTQFVFCDRECEDDWKETLICRPCGVNAKETKNGKETVPDIGQLQLRTDDLAIVAHSNAKYARMCFEQQEQLRRTRARDGPSREEIRVEKALKRIQEWDEVREIRVSKCVKCSGPVAPRIGDLKHVGDSSKQSLDAMASFRRDPEIVNGVCT